VIERRRTQEMWTGNREENKGKFRKEIRRVGSREK